MILTINFFGKRIIYNRACTLIQNIANGHIVNKVTYSLNWRNARDLRHGNWKHLPLRQLYEHSARLEPPNM